MEKNKTGKYFKYAIGEIILVVIGILIALQINNWNEDRKNNIIEKDFVEKLLIDLKGDIIQLNEVIEFNERKIIILDSILVYGSSETNINQLPNQNELYYLCLRGLGPLSYFEPQNRSLAKLAGLGSGVIRKNVGDSIANFQRNIVRIKDMGLNYKKWLFDVRSSQYKLFKSYLTRDSTYYDRSKRQFTGKPYPKINPNNELQTEFFNYVYNLSGVTRNYVSQNYLLGHLGETQDLIAFLKTEYYLEQ